jgi:hypothetical protein
MKGIEMVSDDLRNAYRWHRRHWTIRAYLAIAAARRDVATDKKRYPSSTAPYFGNWQRPEDMGKWDGPRDRAYHMDSFPDGWRNHGNVGELRDEGSRVIDHTGWYCDAFQDATVYGVVLQLPARKGKPTYIPGIAWSQVDGVSCYPNDIHDNLRECARAADHIAEKLGESEREYQEAWQAGSEAASCQGNSDSCRKKIVGLISDLRKVRRGELEPALQPALGNLCDVIRGKVADILAEMYRARERRDELRRDYGSSEAFKEGFSE